MQKILFSSLFLLNNTKAHALNTYVLDSYAKIQCGDTYIPVLFAQIIRFIIMMLQIAVPIIIIILGSIDLVKAVSAQKEDEIKKGQQLFLKRLGVGMSIFLVFFVVELLIGFVKPKNENIEMWNCVNCFVNGECDKITIDN